MPNKNQSEIGGPYSKDNSRIVAWNDPAVAGMRVRDTQGAAQSHCGLGLVAQMSQRNLICHLYPRAAGGHWRSTVHHLLARWQQFDGKKTVAIACDPTTDSPEEVATEFGDAANEITFIPFCNTHLQEVQGITPLLESVQHAPGITLYCHGKGATHLDPAAASHAWRDTMAAACLDYPSLVDCCLKDAGICGTFRSMQPIATSPAQWHFAGTWFWFRNDLLFSKNWWDFEVSFWGVESYPGGPGRFQKHESRCLFFDNAQTGHLYHPWFWRKTLGPAFRTWRERLAKCGELPLCADPPLSELMCELLAPERKEKSCSAVTTSTGFWSRARSFLSIPTS